MNENDLKRIIFRRQLQAILIAAVGVMLSIGLVYVYFSMIERPCDDGCPPQYINFFVSVGIEPSAVSDVLDGGMVVLFLTYLGVWGFAFRKVTSHLRLEIDRAVSETVRQQHREWQAAVRLKQQQSVIGDDGEIVEHEEQAEWQ